MQQGKVMISQNFNVSFSSEFDHRSATPDARRYFHHPAMISPALLISPSAYNNFHHLERRRKLPCRRGGEDKKRKYPSVSLYILHWQHEKSVTKGIRDNGIIGRKLRDSFLLLATRHNFRLHREFIVGTVETLCVCVA